MKELTGGQIDQYRVEALVGKGSLGTVYRAYDPNLDRLVALKVIYPQFARQAHFQNYIVTQAKAAARLLHPNIATLYDVKQTSDWLVLALELVPGMSLATMIAQLRGRQQLLRLEDAVLLMAQVADALAYIHQQGMVHGNLKPGNVLIKRLDRPARSNDLALRAVLTDCGLTRLWPGDNHGAAPLADALPYVSPEQWVGNPPDGRSDIYALGVILYQLVAGYLPFGVKNRVDAMIKHALQQPRPMRRMRPDLPDELVEVIRAAMDKRVDQRLGGAAEMAERLRAVAHALHHGPAEIEVSAGHLIEQHERATAAKDGLLPATVWNLPGDRLPIPEEAVRQLLQSEIAPATGQPAVAPSDAPVLMPRPTPPVAHTAVPSVDHAPSGAPPIDAAFAPQLIVTRPGQEPRTISLVQSAASIGRSQQNEVVLDAPDVSRRHARLEKENGGWRIIDLGSKGGTFWRGRRLPPHAPQLWPPDQPLHVGPYELCWRQPQMAASGNESIADELDTALPAMSNHPYRLRASVTPAQITLLPGERAEVQVSLYNSGTMGDMFTLRVTELSPALVILSQNRVHIEPGRLATLPITLTAPTEKPIPAGQYPFRVVARSTTAEREIAAVRGQMIVAPPERVPYPAWALPVVQILLVLLLAGLAISAFLIQHGWGWFGIFGGGLVEQPAAPVDHLAQPPPVANGSGWITAAGQVSLGFADPPQAGDTAGDEPVRGFLTFDLSQIPAGATVESAYLRFPAQSSGVEIVGQPFAGLGCLVFEVGAFSLPLTAADYDAAAFFINCEPTPPTSLDMLPEVQDALELALAFLQVRFSFDQATNSDGAADLYVLRQAPTLEVNYLTP